LNPQETQVSQPKSKGQGRPKSNQKRLAILECASDLFLQQGYTHTSMDEVAKVSGVSKQTVYSHFKNKELLYTSVIEQKCDQYQIDAAGVCIDTMPIDLILKNIASRFIQLLVDPGVIAMYSVVIGEAKNNPKVAQLFYNAGPLHSVDIVAKLLSKHPQTQLSTDFAKETSHDFFNLLKAEFHMLSMLHLDYDSPLSFENELSEKVVRKTLALIELGKR
jgi:TetR/AcrR family transcriptional repressor of mexJK operon